MLASRIFRQVPVICRHGVHPIQKAAAPKRLSKLTIRATNIRKHATNQSSRILTPSSVRWYTEVAPKKTQHALFGMAKKQLADGDTVLCLETSLKILKDDPENPAVNMFAALSYYNLRQYEKAIDHAERVILKKPDYMEAYHLKGLSLAFLDQYTKAISYFDKALKIDDRNVRTVFARANVLDKMGRWEDAAFGFRKATFIQRTHMSCFRAAECYAKLRKWQDALEYYDMALENWKKHPATWLGKAQILAHQGKPLQALDVIEDMLHETPNNINGLIFQAVLQSKLNKPEAALESVEEALALEDENLPALELKGTLLAHLGRLEEALKIFDKILLRRPDDIPALREKRKVLEKLGDSGEAVEQINARLEKLEKAQESIFLERGSKSWKAERYDEALENYEKLAELHADHPTAALGRGVALTHLGRSKEAKVALQKAIMLQPVTPIAHYYLGQIQQASEEYDAAIKSYRKSLKQQPDNIEALVKIGTVYMLQKEYGDAAEAFEEVLEKDATHAVANEGRKAAHKAMKSAR